MGLLKGRGDGGLKVRGILLQLIQCLVTLVTKVGIVSGCTGIIESQSGQNLTDWKLFDLVCASAPFIDRVTAYGQKGTFILD